MIQQAQLRAYLLRVSLFIIHANKTPPIATLNKETPTNDQLGILDSRAARPVKTCPPRTVLLPVDDAMLVLVLVLLLVLVLVLEPASLPPRPLQIMLPSAADGVEVVLNVTVVGESVIVELPTARKALFGARLTGVSRIVADALPGVSVVPAMTIGLNGKMTTVR